MKKSSAKQVLKKSRSHPVVEIDKKMKKKNSKPKNLKHIMRRVLYQLKRLFE